MTDFPSSPETASAKLADEMQALGYPEFGDCLSFDAYNLILTALRSHGFAQRLAVPDDYAVLPRKLTAENGAKAALIGEFYETTTVMDENGDERPFKVPVSWDTIKRIWDAAVLHFAVSDTSTYRCADPSNCPYPVCVADGHCESSPDSSPDRGSK